MTNPFTQPSNNPFANVFGASNPHMQPLAPWLSPTANVQELERRIQELKTVQFWLEQNTRALSAGIQMLEVQKLTLITLNNMGANMAEMMRSWPSFAQNISPENQSRDAKNMNFSSQDAENSNNKNPNAPWENMMQPWWGALLQQFQNIASQNTFMGATTEKANPDSSQSVES